MPKKGYFGAFFALSYINNNISFEKEHVYEYLTILPHQSIRTSTMKYTPIFNTMYILTSLLIGETKNYFTLCTKSHVSSAVCRSRIKKDVRHRIEE